MCAKGDKQVNRKPQPSANPSLWGGRFSEPTDEFVSRFTASVQVDARLYHYDIQGSIAHANMLHRIGVLDAGEHRAVVDGLAAIRKEIESGEFVWRESLEDVHMNIEARLTELIGDAGKKLHTGRSRNDQVATDVRLWLRDRIDDIDQRLTELMTALLDLTEQHVETIMPGFTHLQAAQPVTFAHHLLAWFEMSARDRERFRDCRRRLNVSPLGSAALAGTTFPIDRRKPLRSSASMRPPATPSTPSATATSRWSSARPPASPPFTCPAGAKSWCCGARRSGSS